MGFEQASLRFSFIFFLHQQSICKCLLTDFALLGHVINKADVFDEFECHLKCMGNSGCKSCNVHPNCNDGKLICE